MALRHVATRMISPNPLRTAAAALGLLLALLAPPGSLAAQSARPATVVAFGLFGEQSVFESEAKGAARIVADRFGVAKTIVRANTKTRADATIRTLAATLKSAGRAMDADHEVLFLILTSHGSPAGLAVEVGVLAACGLACGGFAGV